MMKERDANDGEKLFAVLLAITSRTSFATAMEKVEPNTVNPTWEAQANLMKRAMLDFPNKHPEQSWSKDRHEEEVPYILELHTKISALDHGWEPVLIGSAGHCNYICDLIEYIARDADWYGKWHIRPANESDFAILNDPHVGDAKRASIRRAVDEKS
jgi:hypothetical protein